MVVSPKETTRSSIDRILLQMNLKNKEIKKGHQTSMDENSEMILLTAMFWGVEVNMQDAFTESSEAKQ